MAKEIKPEYKLKKIKITKLFTTFTHTIGINEERGMTLVLGENGLGKTVILKILKLVFEGDFVQLKKYEFERLDLIFEDFKYSFFGTIDIDKPRLTVKKIKGRKTIDNYDFLNVDNNPNTQGKLWAEDMLIRNSFENDFLYRDDYRDEIEHRLRKFVGSSIRRVGRDRWRDRSTNEMLSTSGIIKKYNKYLPKMFNSLISTPVWLEELSSRVNIYIIETQRLRTRKGTDSYQEAILKISEELAGTIKGILAEANEVATNLDRTYPTRLLAKINEPESIGIDELELRLEHLDSRRKRLKEVGLVEPFNDDIQRTNIGHRRQSSDERIDLINNVLLVYIQDSNEKLNIYENIADKLEVFLSILNDRLNVKKIQIDKEKGLDIKSTKLSSNSSKKKIPLSGLSSGEQHMIVMFYNLLFKCEKNSLILIDEPEISLHIGWQNKFIEDLDRIKKINPFDAIIATHSPDIINDNWDLTVQLLDE